MKIVDRERDIVLRTGSQKQQRVCERERFKRQWKLQPVCAIVLPIGSFIVSAFNLNIIYIKIETKQQQRGQRQKQPRAVVVSCHQIWMNIVMESSFFYYKALSYVEKGARSTLETKICSFFSYLFFSSLDWKQCSIDALKWVIQSFVRVLESKQGSLFARRETL